MCTTVVMPNGRWLHSPRELQEVGCKVMGGDLAIELFDNSDVDPMDCCLCTVDVEAVLIRAGFAFQVEPDGFIELLTCARCRGPVRGYGTAGDEKLCHPEEGEDCFHLVTVLHHPLADGRRWTGAGWATPDRR